MKKCCDKQTTKLSFIIADKVYKLSSYQMCIHTYLQITIKFSWRIIFGNNQIIRFIRSSLSFSMTLIIFKLFLISFPVKLPKPKSPWYCLISQVILVRRISGNLNVKSRTWGKHATVNVGICDKARGLMVSWRHGRVSNIIFRNTCLGLAPFYLP